jgi:hypothetical protein
MVVVGSVEVVLELDVLLVGRAVELVDDVVRDVLLELEEVLVVDEVVREELVALLLEELLDEELLEDEEVLELEVVLEEVMLLEEVALLEVEDVLDDEVVLVDELGADEELDIEVVEELEVELEVVLSVEVVLELVVDEVVVVGGGIVQVTASRGRSDDDPASLLSNLNRLLCRLSWSWLIRSRNQPPRLASASWQSADRSGNVNDPVPRGGV